MLQTMKSQLWRRARGTRLLYAFAVCAFAASVFAAGAFVAVHEAAAAQRQSPLIVLQIEGPVTPAMLDYFQRGIDAATTENAAAVLIILDTPGGSVNVTLDIVQAFQRATVPIIVYVAPVGAQAASAGSLITAAAHVAAMAPGTAIGAASPIDLSGEDIPETAFRKATEDLKAVMRNLAADRGEAAVALGEAMIDEARAVTADEALEIGFIDVVAVDVPDLLTQLDGRTVVVDGETRTLQLTLAQEQPVEMNALESILHALANPTLIGFLLAIAIPAILIELQSPGGWVAGFIGVICLLLALYGLGQLPVNWLGLVLVIVAFILLLMEAVSSAHGGLALAGIVTLVAGLLVLFNSPSSPEFTRISLAAAVGISLPSAALFLAIASLAWRSHRQPAQTGGEGLIGMVGHVRKPLDPQGTILVNGELWRAVAAKGEGTLETGTAVVVESKEGFTLYVRANQSL
ncbi:MAG: nodulation protein NfeD [Anaerolineales bacterium]|nr:nodulation protein NfeD [Anaerolineales bacterium]MCB8950450.1 nodulation protein NfeD [Ardenticatenales bacterium]